MLSDPGEMLCDMLMTSAGHATGEHGMSAGHVMGDDMMSAGHVTGEHYMSAGHVTGNTICLLVM